MRLRKFAPAAVISSCGAYRYFLSRQLGLDDLTVTFLGLNPSTADATRDDPTIRRCIGFARGWGGGTLQMVNLFALRSTNPRNLLAADDPIGSENDDWIDRAVSEADIVVAAWGVHGALRGRALEIASRFPKSLQVLGVTKAGMPRHPLYVASTTPLRPFPY